jgi:hypothetical protein
LILLIFFTIFSQLLPQAFGEYVRFYGFDDLKVCTDDGRANKFWVFTKETPAIMTELGFLWNSVCQQNNFHPGDTLRFKFGTFNRCHLYKIN